MAQLRTFVTIAENRHFGTAAAKLRISQPSLSQALVALENNLGVQLIERSTRKVIVTPIGEKLLPLAKATLDAASAFMAQARGADGVLQGPLSIGIIPTASPYILPTLLSILSNDYPDLEPCIIEDQTRNLEMQLRDGQLDCALVATKPTSSGLRNHVLYNEEFIVALPADHPYAGRRDLTLAEVNSLTLLLLSDAHCLRNQILDLCSTTQSEYPGVPDTLAHASSLTTIMQCVEAGLGSTLVPLSAVESECLRRNVSVAQFNPGVNSHRTMRLLYRSSSMRNSEYASLAQAIVKAYESVTEHLDPWQKG